MIRIVGRRGGQRLSKGGQRLSKKDSPQVIRRTKTSVTFISQILTKLALEKLGSNRLGELCRGHWPEDWAHAL